MSRDIEVLGALFPSAQGARRAYDIVAALTPPAKTEVVGATPTSPVKPEVQHLSVGKAAVGIAPGVAGAIVGAVAWRKHRVLGLLLGHAVGASSYDLYQGDKKKALCQMAVEGAGVAGALAYKKHPVIGYAAGLIAGAVATAFIDGSPAQKAYERIKAELFKK